MVTGPDIHWLGLPHEDDQKQVEAITNKQKRLRTHSEEVFQTQQFQDSGYSTGDPSNLSSESDNTSDQTQALNACRPMTSLLSIKDDECQAYVIDACAGLSGKETVHQWPCVLYDDKLIVWLDETSLSMFTKSTFMNLCEFAEQECAAKKLVFLLSATHSQKSQYKQMFKVIDVRRLSSSQVCSAFNLEDKAAAKKILETQTVYELLLW